MFLEYSNTLTEKNIIEFVGEDSVIILVNFIANTNIFSIENSILNVKKYEYISTNINYYFGYSHLIKNNITKNNIEDLLCNILYKNENTIIWSDLIIRYYNKHFNSYTNKQIDTLNNLLKKIQILYFKN